MDAIVKLVPARSPPPAHAAYLEHRERLAAIALERAPLDAQHAAAARAVAQAGAPTGELGELRARRQGLIGEWYLGGPAEGLDELERQIAEQLQAATARGQDAEAAAAAVELLTPLIQAVHNRYLTEAARGVELQRAAARERLLTGFPVFQRAFAAYTDAYTEFLALILASDAPIPAGNLSPTAAGMPTVLRVPVPVDSNIKAFQTIVAANLAAPLDISGAATRRAAEILAELQAA
jgi:hypothetical protein